jgi:hypothetical protein
LTIHLWAIDLSSRPDTGYISVRLTTDTGRRLAFNLVRDDAADLGASLSEHAVNV